MSLQSQDVNLVSPVEINVLERIWKVQNTPIYSKLLNGAHNFKTLFLATNAVLGRFVSMIL